MSSVVITAELIAQAVDGSMNLLSFICSLLLPNNIVKLSKAEFKNLKKGASVVKDGSLMKDKQPYTLRVFQ